ncbi:SDR family oxidoreductase (plasmid) [Sphingomonas paeninsulae]|uniref:SDR family oxidoreductase n=1 Tax=Sphingomonas paeninsulae TaxID=2319844 RepID=A0A494TCR1_SPHPE|nr:SDR family oxidoreductase [Sphingomonas paeninsulae]AYJ84873.1 SDR family oxidoreductase [Sphingomonas paeninsulae]
MMPLKQRVAALTGSANGIGRAAAVRLASDGANVALLDRDADGLGETERLIVQSGGRVMTLVGDLTDATFVQGAFARIAGELGPVDILLNNVGQSAREKASEFWCSEPALWDFMIDISLKTTMLCSHQVVGSMRERKRGRIINISSESAYIGSKNATAYAAAKAGVIGFTRSLARELAPFHVGVNAVAPGYTRTQALDRLPQEIVQKAIAEIPLGFVGEPEDIAHAIAFFASDESRYITGQTLLVNGGRWAN